MDITGILAVLFRWGHILAGILWIGLLYFFNFVNGQFAGTLDGDTKQKVIPELAPRALYWFRWGAMYTWITGLFLLYFVFESSHVYLSDPAAASGASVFLLYSFVLAIPIYDIVCKTIGKNPMVLTVVGFILICGVMYLMEDCLNFSYRGYMIYTGAMFGSIMAFNVWQRIWPAQKKIINGVKTGNPADAAVAKLAGTRSKHNTYLSVPLVWAMINAHTAFLASGMCDWLIMAGVIVVGWSVVMMIYKKAATIKGF